VFGWDPANELAAHPSADAHPRTSTRRSRRR
jgi:hypothetical protein